MGHFRTWVYTIAKMTKQITCEMEEAVRVRRIVDGRRKLSLRLGRLGAALVLVLGLALIPQGRTAERPSGRAKADLLAARAPGTGEILPEGGVGGPHVHTIRVSGKVTDKRTGLPIAGATVRGHVTVMGLVPEDLPRRGRDWFGKCPYQEAMTDARGTCRLAFRTPLTTSGRWRGRDGLCVYAAAPDYESFVRDAWPGPTTHSTDFPDMDFALGRGKLTRGQVVDEDEALVDGALVRVQAGMNGDWGYFGALGRVYTDIEGRFAIRMPTDRSRFGRDRCLVISKEGHGAAVFEGAHKNEDMGILTMRRGENMALIPSYNVPVAESEYLWDPAFWPEEEQMSISGRLLGDDLPFALDALEVVLVERPGPRPCGQAAVEADGSFGFPHVYPGQYGLLVFAPGDSFHEGNIGRTEVDVVGGKNVGDVVIQLDPVAEVRVRFVGEDGAPLAGITPIAPHEKHDLFSARGGAVSDEQGRTVLYLDPGLVHYVSGLDREDASVWAEEPVEVLPEHGQTVDEIRVIMVPAGVVPVPGYAAHTDHSGWLDRVLSLDKAWSRLCDIHGTVWQSDREIYTKSFIAELEAAESAEGFGQMHKEWTERRKRLPAPEVVVTLQGNSVTRRAITDAGGTFQFTALPGGVYELSAEAAVRSSRTGAERTAVARQRVKHAGKDSSLDLELRTDLASVRGRVMDVRGRPVAGAKVTTIYDDPVADSGEVWRLHRLWVFSHARSTVSNADGFYELQSLEPTGFEMIAPYVYGGNAANLRWVSVRVEVDGYVQAKEKVSRVPLLTEEGLYWGRRFLRALARFSEEGYREKEDLSLPSIQGNTITGIDIVLDPAVTGER